MDVLVVDYAMGNLRSVENAFRSLGVDVRVSTSPDELRHARGIVLPGVGAFGDGMRNLRDGGWIEPLTDAVIRRETPFLGLCLGMQLIAERGFEHGDHAGLGWVRGTVARLRGDGLRVPHIGWNDVSPRGTSRLLAGLDAPTFYFVHSYVLRPDDGTDVTGVCSYGEEFPAVIERGNILATQFHPEKSQRDGLAVLRAFAELAA